MKLSQFVKSLLPSFKRSKVEVDLKQLEDILKKVVLPTLKKAVEVTRGEPLQSAMAVSVDIGVRKASGINSSAITLLGILYNMYAALLPKLDYIGKIIDDEFEPDLSRDNMTYKQLSIVRFLELARFGIDYGVRLTSRLLAAEARTRLNQTDRIDDQLTPSERKYMDDNLGSFLQIVGLLHVPLNNLRQALEKMPEVVVVPEKADTAEQLVGLDKLDPLRLGFINSSALDYNFIYHFRLMKAEAEVRHYKLMEKEAQALELRILELKEAYQNRQDPRLQQQLEYREGQLQRLRIEYNELTEEFGLT